MFLTIFTPAYNRANTIARTYESLRRQTCKDFLWMVVDDGSKDNTKELVDAWQKSSDNGFQIKYIYKENGGLHTAYNTAIANMDSELAVCIDSDDYMPDNAVELIRKKWQKDGSDSYAGIVGLDYTIDGDLIGGKLPEQKAVNLIDIYTGKCPVKKGDKKNVVRVDLYKSVAPMKVFHGEKNFNPHYMHLLISRRYDFLVFNEPLCIVDYQSNGMTASQYKQYWNSPNSFMEIRKLHLSFKDLSDKRRVQETIHLLSSSILAHKFLKTMKEYDNKMLAVFCIPPALLLTAIVSVKGRP